MISHKRNPRLFQNPIPSTEDGVASTRIDQPNSNPQRPIYECPSMKWCASQWYENNPRRLRYEEEAMAERIELGLFALVEQDGTGNLYWDGVLEPGSGQRYRIAAMYPFDYPHQFVRIYPIDPVIPEDCRVKHMFRPTGEAHYLCLYTPEEFASNEHATACTIINRAALWLAVYEDFLVTGEWIGPEHGVDT
jgi:hypothetical protein